MLQTEFSMPFFLLFISFSRRVDFADGNLLKLFDLHILVSEEIIREFSIICMRYKDEDEDYILIFVRLSLYISVTLKHSSVLVLETIMKF